MTIYFRFTIALLCSLFTSELGNVSVAYTQTRYVNASIIFISQALITCANMKQIKKN